MVGLRSKEASFRRRDERDGEEVETSPFSSDEASIAM